MQVKLKIDNASIHRLSRQAKSYGREVARMVNKETAYAAQEIRTKAIDAVPVDTGRLKASIEAQEVRGLLNKGVSTFRVGTNVEYAAKVEFGSEQVTSFRLSRGFKYTGKQKAKPYLRPAFYAVIGGYKKAILKILRSAK